MVNSFIKELEKYGKISFSECGKEDGFERLIKSYLVTDSKDVNQFKRVSMLNGFSSIAEIGSTNSAIDLIFFNK